jgi:peptidoglycan/LPS O-acetylase OafA/YrhL
MEESNSKKYVYSLDYMRGVAALAVVAYHLTSYGAQKQWMLESPLPSLAATTHYGLFGVHFFFMISGFVILMSAQRATLKQFAVSRAARLYPAFWAGCILTTLTAYLLGSKFPLPTVTSFLANLTIVPEWFGANLIDGAYWSLLVEVHFYLFIAMLIAFKQMSRIELILYCWIATSVIDLFIPIWKLNFLFNIRWASLFAAGAISWIILDRGSSVTRWGAFSICAILTVLKFGTYTGLSLNWADYKADPISIAIILCFYSCFALIALEKFKPPSSKIGYYMGALTYPVYVLHQNIGYSTYDALRMKFTNLSPVVVFIIVLLLVFSAALLVFKFVEKPLGRQIKKLAGTPGN